MKTSTSSTISLYCFFYNDTIIWNDKITVLPYRCWQCPRKDCKRVMDKRIADNMKDMQLEFQWEE